MKAKAQTEHEEGLLEYLEDIIGTNKYIEQIENCARTVDSANDLCATKTVRVKAAEREVQFLEKDKKAAENYIRMENQLVIQKAEYYQVSRFKAQELIAKASAKLEQLREKLATETAANDAKSAEAREFEEQLRVKSNELVDLEKQASHAAKQLSSLEKQDVKLQETKKHLKTKIKSLQKSLTDDSKSRSSIQHEIAECEQEMQVLTANIKELESSLATSEADLATISESLKGKTTELQSQLDALQKQMAPWTEKIRQEQDALESAVLALSAFERKQKAGEGELAEAENRLSSVKNELSLAEKSRASLESQKAELASQVSTLEKEICAGENVQADVAASIATVQTTLAEANESLRQNNSGNAVISALMKEASSGRIKGVYGRLGDLGIIDAKYDVAISTACSMLNSIVVDTPATGRQCVDFVRKNNLGRVSVIILEKMRPAEMKTSHLPSGAVRLFDLVKVKDKALLPAFYFALTDTLVADNMDQARRLAYGDRRRFRVVTVDGKLLDTSGTMSGGGNQTQQGGMKASFAPEVSREQLAALNELLAQKLAEQKKIQSALLKFSENLARTKTELKRVDMELGKNEIALKSLPSQIADLEEAVAVLKAKERKQASKADDEKMNKLKAQVLQHEGNIKELKESCATLQQSIDACQAQILEAGGTRFKAQRSKVNDLRDQLKLQEKRLLKVSTTRTNLEKKAKEGSSVGSAGLEAEIASLEAEVVQIEAKIEQLTKDAFEQKQATEAVAKQMSLLQEEIADLKKENEALAKQLSKFRRVEFELKSEIERGEAEIAEQEAEIKHLNKALSSLQLNPIRLDDQAMAQEIPIFDEVEDLKLRVKSLDSLRSGIEALEDRIAASEPNLKVLDEFREREAVFLALRDELTELESSRDANRDEYESLRKRRHDEFMAGFRQISIRLKELYQLITMGGNAELELVDSLDPFSEGILFSVMPPKKSWKNISNLSGGEKTLASLALVFALHSFKPTPIYVMDEIDAALDFRNVSIVANYIKERTRDAQFIVISLRNNMFELADRLVGIYKTQQRTKSVTIDPATFSVGNFIAGTVKPEDKQKRPLQHESVENQLVNN